MISALHSGSSDPGSSPGRGKFCVLGQNTLFSRCFSAPSCTQLLDDRNVAWISSGGMGHLPRRRLNLIGEVYVNIFQSANS